MTANRRATATRAATLLELAEQASLVSTRQRQPVDQVSDPTGRLDVLLVKCADRLAAGRLDPQAWNQLRPLVERAVQDHVPARNVLAMRGRPRQLRRQRR